MIAKKRLKDIFKLKKSIFVKNPGAHFTLKISTNQRFGKNAYFRTLVYQILVLSRAFIQLFLLSGLVVASLNPKSTGLFGPDKALGEGVYSLL